MDTKTNPTIPFKAESLEKLKARYEDAIMFTWIVTNDMKTSPSKYPEHIFDSTDGIRLIISKEEYADGTCIHISASFDKSCEEEFNKHNVQDFKSLLDLFVKRFYEISQETKPVHLVTVTKEGIPHFKIKL